MADLIDLLAAHAVVDMTLDGGGVQCKCQPRPMDGTCMWSPEDQAAHVALMVEQHTNGRITELEADITRRKVRNTLSRMGRDDDPETIAAWRETVMGWMDRAENAEIEAEDLKSTIARVEAAMEKAPVYQLACEHRFDEPYETVEVIELRRVRAALEGEQQ